jgi:hypothetical protein
VALLNFSINSEWAHVEFLLPLAIHPFCHYSPNCQGKFEASSGKAAGNENVRMLWMAIHNEAEIVRILWEIMRICLRTQEPPLFTV